MTEQEIIDVEATPRGALALALAKAQADFPAIERTKTVKVKTKTGGEYSFKYAPLDSIFAAVTPVLSKNGLALSQLLTVWEGRQAIETVLLHSDGGALRAICPLPLHGNETAQEIGSAITYLRRYAVVAILGIATEEDDDGQAATRGRNKSAGEPRGTKRTASAPPPAAAEASSEERAAASPAEVSDAAVGESAVSGSASSPLGEPERAASESPFKAPTGPRGGQATLLEAGELANELVALVEVLGATDSLPKIQEKRDAGDVAWLKRQIATAKKAIERRAAEAA